MASVMRWVFGRVAVVYLIVFVFGWTCLDLKTIGLRVKMRHLNDSIPDFSDMIIFEKDPKNKKDIQWQPYRDYFELIGQYMPNDVVARQLLGYVEYFTGQQDKAEDLFKGTSSVSGHLLFWSNFNLGVLYYKKEMWAQAAEYLFKAVSSSPQLALLLMRDSIMYKQIFSSLYFKFSLEHELNMAQAQAYILLLSCYYKTGQLDKVVLMANWGLNNPDLPLKDAFYYYEGMALLGMGQFEKAVIMFQKSLDVEKGNPDVYFYLGEIYQKAGQMGQARQLLQLSYALHQKNDPRFPYEDHIELRFF